MDDKKIQILVVEDVEIAQKIASHILSKLNCSVNIAGTGSQALELIKKEYYALIFMDLGLPDIDGTVISETIRQTDNINQNTPIVALTAHSKDEALAEECARAGMNDFLTKPLTVQNAIAVLTKYT